MYLIKNVFYGVVARGVLWMKFLLSIFHLFGKKRQFYLDMSKI